MGNGLNNLFFTLIFFFQSKILFSQEDIYEPIGGSYHSDDIIGNPMNFESTLSLLLPGIILLFLGYLILVKSKSSWGLIGMVFILIGVVCVAPAIISLSVILSLIGVVGFILFIIMCFFRNN
ncbi:hypothetical protein [Flavobacterium sp. UMI-01]|uniref:hypothetical protein n=1 Tax=Flavobacterium sp. UMI-01 TaxID=1441053 RepID=UPI001C7DE025|nr:hypothetical protein [Flavobacterium sp. UMI-01]GIZ07899.1 hypothetical protein FUMI01_06260 [Flavobacterium sp. UMI-01]